MKLFPIFPCENINLYAYKSSYAQWFCNACCYWFCNVEYLEVCATEQQIVPSKMAHHPFQKAVIRRPRPRFGMALARWCLALNFNAQQETGKIAIMAVENHSAPEPQTVSRRQFPRCPSHPIFCAFGAACNYLC